MFSRILSKENWLCQQRFLVNQLRISPLYKGLHFKNYFMESNSNKASRFRDSNLIFITLLEQKEEIFKIKLKQFTLIFLSHSLWFSTKLTPWNFILHFQFEDVLLERQYLEITYFNLRLTTLVMPMFLRLIPIKKV